MVVRHNVPAMNNERMLSVVTGREAKHAEKLSSGYRINRAADDAAGLAISEKMRRQIRGLTQASANAQDGISLVQSAEGALHEVHDMLQRMNELAVRAANGTNSDQDRMQLQAEVDQIVTEIDRVAHTTTFNDMKLLDGSFSSGMVQKQAASGTSAPDTATAPRRNPLRITLDSVVHKVVNVTQEPNTRYTTMAGYDELKATLKNEILPQAVSALTDTFDDTYGYLKDMSIGIGLTIYEDDSDATLAYVSVAPSRWNTVPVKFELEFSMGVNLSTLSLNGDGTLTDATRLNMESTITHEMMHALMMESLTRGMVGMDADANYGGAFPDWFVEGTAQMAGGGMDWVRSRGGLALDETMDEAAIGAALGSANKSLASGTSASHYATGYLAAMYLGYLAYGGTSMEEAHIAAGMDHLMNEIKGGKSLDQVIRENTAYAGLSDFEANFAADGAAFTKDLLIETGNGRGALVNNDLTQTDLLPDTASANTTFVLNTDYIYVNNIYPDGYPVMAGGGSNQTGIAGQGYTPATDIPGGGGGTAPGGGTGGTITPGGGTGGGAGTAGTAPGAGNVYGGGGKSDSLRGGLHLQVGSEAGEHIILHIEAVNAEYLGVDRVDIRTVENAAKSIDTISYALHRVAGQRSSLGACQNRLEHTVRNLDNVVENTQASESRIRDTDMAEEMVQCSNLRIIRQAGISMLAGSRRNNEGVLALLA